MLRPNLFKDTEPYIELLNAIIPSLRTAHPVQKCHLLFLLDVATCCGARNQGCLLWMPTRAWRAFCAPGPLGPEAKLVFWISYWVLLSTLSPLSLTAPFWGHSMYLLSPTLQWLIILLSWVGISYYSPIISTHSWPAISHLGWEHAHGPIQIPWAGDFGVFSKHGLWLTQFHLLFRGNWGPERRTHLLKRNSGFLQPVFLPPSVSLVLTAFLFISHKEGRPSSGSPEADLQAPLLCTWLFPFIFSPCCDLYDHEQTSPRP